MGEISGKIYFDPLHPGSFKGLDKLHDIVVKEGKHHISIGKIKKIATGTGILQFNEACQEKI